MLRNSPGILLTCLTAFAACEPSAPKPKIPPMPSVRVAIENERRGEKPEPLGKPVLRGDYIELRASPDGRWLTALKDSASPSGIGLPPALKVGALWLVGADGAGASHVASQVQNFSGGWLFSPDSKWLLAVGNYSTERHDGDLVVVSTPAAQAPQVLASMVTYFVPSAQGAVAFVSDGTLRLGPLPSGPFREIATKVSTAQFSPDGARLYFTHKIEVGGALYEVLADSNVPPRLLVDAVADYTVANGGTYVAALNRKRPTDREFQLSLIDVATHTVRPVTDSALRYRLSPSARYIAWRTRSSAGKGELADVGDLYAAELPRGKPVKLATSVRDFEFSPSGDRLAYRSNWRELALGGRDGEPADNLIEALGELSVAQPPTAKPTLIEKASPNFLFAQNGQALAFTARVEKPSATRKLYLLPTGVAKPVELGQWVYEYQFRPPGDELLFRSDCTREGRSCELYRVSSRADAKPKSIASKVFGMLLSSDGERAILARAHLLDGVFDVSAFSFDGGTETPIDSAAKWPLLLLGDDGSKVAYLRKGGDVDVAVLP